MTNQSFLSRAINRSFFYGFSSILGKIVGFVMLPIYTNYLTPKDYGVAGFLIFYVSLAQILLGGKLEQAISKFHYDKLKADTLGSILLTSTVFTTAMASFPLALSWFFASDISLLLFDSSDYRLAVQIVSLNILFGTLELYGLQYIKIADMPKTYLALNLIKLATQLFINIWLIVYLDYGILGVVVSSAAAAILLTFLTTTIIWLRESAITFNRALIPDLFWYSAPLWLSGLLGLYSGSISQVFIKEFAGLSDLGLYNLAATFGALVATLGWTPFFNFWSVERFRIYENSNAKKTYQAVFYWSSGISLFLAFGIAVFSDPVIRIMANEDFHDAAAAVAPLALFNTVMFLGWFLNFSFLVTENNREIAHNGFIYAALITVAFFVAIPNWGFVGAAYGLLIANLINLHIINWRAKKFYDIEVSILKVDVMMVITLTSIYLFGLINAALTNPLVAAAVNTAILFATLALCLTLIHILRPRLLEQVINRIKLRKAN